MGGTDVTVCRIAGAVCLFACGCLLGCWRAARLKRRVTSLEEMRGFFEKMCVSIEYAALPMEEIMRDAARSGGPVVFSDCLSRLEGGEPFPEAFAASLRQYAAELALTPEVAGILIRTAERLGRTDAKGQAALLRLGLCELEPGLASASEDARRRGKLFRSLGLLGGLLGVVLFL